MSHMDNTRPKVALAKCQDYDEDSVYAAVDRAIDLLASNQGLKKYIKPGDKVLLKVNLLQGKDPKRAISTHPSLVKAVIELVHEAEGIAFVGDSPAVSTGAGFKKAAETAGFVKVCEDEGATLIELDEPIDAKVPNGKLVRSITLSKKLEQFDVIINMPKLKTHTLCMYTGAVKNLYGCVAGKKKGYYHLIYQDPQRFSQLLLDLGTVVKPQLNIMDGIIGMEGDGPASGSPREVGVILASESPNALDAVAIEIIGYRPKDIFTVSLAQRAGIAGSDLRNVCPVGDILDAFRIKDYKKPKKNQSGFLPHWLGSRVRALFTARPIVNSEMCIGCGNCKAICPNNAITMVLNNKDPKWDEKSGKKKRNAIPQFDYDKCIRCYCCHEICPEKAIHLKDSILSKPMDKFTRL